MYDQIRGDTIFIMLYAIVTATALQASCYLLFRRGNAFAPSLLCSPRLESPVVYAHLFSLLQR